MKAQSINQEIIIKSGKANLQRGIETVGGKLYFTNTVLVFEPHSVNIQVGLEVIELSAIEKVKPGWTKFLGLIPLLPNAFTVFMANKRFDFTVYDRKEWVETLSRQISSQSDS